MRFELTPDQRDFRAALDDLLASGEPVAVARAWAEGDHAAGLGTWKRLHEAGVTGLLVPEEEGGLGGSLVDLVVAHEALGHHLAVGPWIETGAYLATLPEHRRAVAHGGLLTVASPYALDADVAELIGSAGRAPGERVVSVDATRRLFRVEADAARAELDATGFDVAALACAAQLLGAAERVLADAVAHVQQRHQFGRPIGSFQAVKHRLADVRIALDFARPLVYGAAVSSTLSLPVRSSAEDDEAGRARARSVSAAKAFTADAAWQAARAALQVHGAVGYTRGLDLGLWILRIRALHSAWGTPAFHRARVLETLVSA